MHNYYLDPRAPKFSLDYSMAHFDMIPMPKRDEGELWDDAKHEETLFFLRHHQLAP